ncbi:unnamed protein product [Ambrosiozyma monospora]|uniref:Unnamed protein product n=1 Tax=Ambrosiozyma monospora TaxID=43982 RepID=A0A9W7DJR1_AMBMO|nr:unnamed protein product [Ambrosiozyma monospora]
MTTEPTDSHIVSIISTNNQDNDEIDIDPMSILLKSVIMAAKNAVIYGYRVRFIHAISTQLVSLNMKKNSKMLYKQLWFRLVKSIKMSLNHGKILAGFAIVYKTLLLILTQCISRTGLDETKKARLKHLVHFISGFIGGSLVYGGLINSQTGSNYFNESIASQITLYCLSRVALSIGRWIGVLLTKLIYHRITELSNELKNDGQHGHYHSHSLKNGITIEKLRLFSDKIHKIGWGLNSGVVWGLAMMFYSIDKEFYLQKSLKLSFDFIYGDKMYDWLEVFNYAR